MQLQTVFYYSYMHYIMFVTYLFINTNKLDALNFIISLFQASTRFEHMYSSSGGQNCIIQSLVSWYWNKWMVL